MFSSLSARDDAQECRDLARRVRRLAATSSSGHDRMRLERHADELEQQAERLDRQASAARFPVAASDQRALSVRR